MRNERQIINENHCHVASLLQNIDSHDWLLRKTVAEKLGEYKNIQGVFSSLEKLTQDSDRFVRKSALLSISKFDNEKVIIQALKILQNAMLNDTETDIRLIASDLFGQLSQK